MDGKDLEMELKMTLIKLMKNNKFTNQLFYLFFDRGKQILLKNVNGLNYQEVSG